MMSTLPVSNTNQALKQYQEIMCMSNANRTSPTASPKQQLASALFYFVVVYSSFYFLGHYPNFLTLILCSPPLLSAQLFKFNLSIKPTYRTFTTPCKIHSLHTYTESPFGTNCNRNNSYTKFKLMPK